MPHFISFCRLHCLLGFGDGSLASLQEQAFDSRITIGGFLGVACNRPLPPINLPNAAGDLAEQITMTGLLQTRIELDMQQQNGFVGLAKPCRRAAGLQHTVEGVSTVAISVIYN